MEPNYIGSNGRLDAMAAAWLLENDHVFFLDDDIAWDGQRHSLTGAQANSDNMDEAPVFAENCKTLVNGVLDLMTELEQDESLRIARDGIHQALHRAIREGDLTGITLFNLIACNHAMKIAQAEDAAYQVLCDERLVRGIPSFYELVSRMIKDMRVYNGIAGGFTVSFAAEPCPDADLYMDAFEGTVEGAISELQWTEEVEGARLAESTSQVQAAVSDDPMTVLKNAMPEIQTLRALLEGDASAILEHTMSALSDLANALTEETGIDFSQLDSQEPDAIEGGWTFNEGKTAKGRRFTIGLPDQFAEVTDCGGRPLAVPVEELSADGEEADYSECTQVNYSSMLGDLEDEMRKTYEESLIPETRIQMNRQTLYGNGGIGMGGGAVDDWIVEGKNCQVQVFDIQLPTFFAGLDPGHEYYVKPVVYDHEDMLRITDSFSHLAADDLKALAFAIAERVEVDKPVKLKRISQLEEYRQKMADSEEFSAMVYTIGNVLMMSGNSRVNAELSRAQRIAGDDSAQAASKTADVCARSFYASLEERAQYFKKIVEVLEAQKKLGNPNYAAMWELVGTLGDTLMQDHVDIEGDEELTAAVNATGIVKIPDLYKEFRNEWIGLAPDDDAQSAPPSAKASAPAAAPAQAQPAKREPRKLNESFSTSANARIEKMLNEKVSASYFVSTSEMAAESLMSARQRACDNATSSWNTDEDNVKAMAREFGKFNKTICRYFGYFVDALETQVEFGAPAGDIRKMKTEVGEFSELVADRFSCGNAYLDSVANMGSPVSRPADYASIRARLQKINA